MIVVAFIGPADDHNREVLAGVDTVVVDGGFEEMSILVKPLGEVERRSKRHC